MCSKLLDFFQEFVFVNGTRRKCGKGCSRHNYDCFSEKLYPVVNASDNTRGAGIGGNVLDMD